ncbi:MAG: GMC family oxidoreductase [Pirellulales bacterium]
MHEQAESEFGGPALEYHIELFAYVSLTPDKLGRTLFGEALRRGLRKRLTSQFRISYSTETLPDRENRVELSQTKVDQFDIPLPRIYFKPSEYQLAAFAKGRQVIAAIFKALGTVESQLAEDRRAYSSANHIIGTCRMGHDPKKSVVTPECQSHDHANLFIVGATVFPTAGTANPTLTAVAVLLRSLRDIEKPLLRGSQL